MINLRLAIVVPGTQGKQNRKGHGPGDGAVWRIGAEACLAGLRRGWVLR